MYILKLSVDTEIATWDLNDLIQQLKYPWEFPDIIYLFSLD